MVKAGFVLCSGAAAMKGVDVADRVDIKALFLGPKSENRAFFEEMLNFMITDHIEWRQYFHPDDRKVITEAEQRRAGFLETLQKTRQALVDLAGRLQVSSTPWFSPRYLGHMNADTLMAANLGYMLTLLYNPNNCAYEGSPATTGLEIEVGRQLARLMGYDPARAWGHITSGGMVANYEALWVARNLKSLPRAVQEAAPGICPGLSRWELLNLPVGAVLDLWDQVKAAGLAEEVRGRSVRGVGMAGWSLGQLLVPQSKHYSWTKAADILGLGQDNLVSVRVKDNYRLDVDHLKQLIDRALARRVPILGVVAVVGTTEEGAVDEVHEIVRLRQEYEREGVSFYLHLDAAYGGYARALFLDQSDRFMTYAELKQALGEQEIVDQEVHWPRSEVYEAFKAMPAAESITIDPHKMGYIPYAAGAIVFQDHRVTDLISYFAPYVFDKAEDDPLLLGSYIMEGSKSGAAAAAVWVAHQVVPLNVTGYGRIVGASIEGAYRFYASLRSAEPFEVNGRRFVIQPLAEPDFNVVNFAFNEQGNVSLKAMNELNQRIYEACSYKSGPIYANDFITSKTALSFDEYGDTPEELASRLGIPDEEWPAVRSVYVLRSCVVTPYLVSNTTYERYWQNFLKAMFKALKRLKED